MNYVISLGGSIIVPDRPDVKFLAKFRKLILTFVQKGNVFFLVCGGGAPTRVYQNAAQQITKVSSEDLDWLGIAPTKVNAELLRVIFRKQTSAFVNSNPTIKLSKL